MAEGGTQHEIRVAETSSKVGLQAGAFKTGTHDDLVTSAALSCPFDPSGQSVKYWPAPWV